MKHIAWITAFLFATSSIAANLEDFDTNADGYFSKQEFSAAFPQNAAMFDEIDDNQDGQLSLSEIDAAIIDGILQ